MGHRMGRLLLAVGLVGLAVGAFASWGYWEEPAGPVLAQGPVGSFPSSPAQPPGGVGGTGAAGGPSGAPRALPRADAPYDGPADARSVLAACLPIDARFDCYLDKLEPLLAARGSEVTYSTLADMAAMDSGVDGQSHPMAHVLGAYAYQVYGTIQATLENCSYKVFQGCFHGAFQAYLTDQPDITPALVQTMCRIENTFRLYVCLHGLGHGLMLATEGRVNQSLALCDALGTDYARGSCYGGVFMENLVAYIDSTQPSAIAGHLHGETYPFMVDADDPYFPCDVVLEKYKTSCWLIQTSLMLFFNHGDFADIAEKCATLPQPHYLTCFGSMGRDASAYSARDPQRVVEDCAYAPADGRAQCIHGYIAEVILNYVDPAMGVRMCKELPPIDKTPCYSEVGTQGWGMVGRDAMVAICATAETGYENACRSAALLPAK